MTSLIFLIQRKSVLLSFVGSYLYFGLVCMATWGIVGPDGSISANALPLMFMGGFIVAEYIRSIMFIIMYGRLAKTEIE
ncbi:MAG: hypothetical protein GY869_19155 [Planctomycetes bacterium]|nr:hypothetical protein [Planctomycetota bacterium]